MNDGRWGYWSGGSELSGAADRWEVRWQREPDPRHIAYALTDPVAGIPGAQSVAEPGGSYIDVTLDGASLRLRRADGRGQ
ncbi:hypothetical protein Ato02nite_094480 [Paractinoplanes toevensis]|uniref:Uncharacterized protein n=1 Tax=Paractinoplanes toevensis TaxID=571911 RepID=A0A919WCG7_9ACTN|nr:hypothetical protein Ato02nite_094480 [Actinoplanes toevensis]